MSDQVVVTRSGGVCEIQLNRPEKRNAITMAMYRSEERRVGKECVP